MSKEKEISSKSKSTLDNVANPHINNIILLDSPYSTAILTMLTSIFMLMLSKETGNKMDIESLSQTLNQAIAEDRKHREEMLKRIEEIIGKKEE